MTIVEPGPLGLEAAEAIRDKEILPARQVIAAHLVEDDDDGELRSRGGLAVSRGGEDQEKSEHRSKVNSHESFCSREQGKEFSGRSPPAYAGGSPRGRASSVSWGCPA